METVIAEMAKKKQSSHTEQGYQKSDKAVHTLPTLAKAAGVSHDTIHKVKVIQEKATPEQKERLTKERSSINAINREIKRVDKKEEIKKLTKKELEGKISPQ